MVFNDPKGNQVRSLKRAPRQVAVATDLRNASVSGGRTRFVGLLSLIVQGSALVSGLLTVAGNLIVTGYHGITGNLNVSGPWNLSGTGGITGNVSSTGAWTQSGTMTLTGAGKIQSASVVMDAAGLSSPFILSLTTPTVLVSNAMSINGNLTTVGAVKVGSLPIASGTVYMVVADAAGNLYRKATPA